MRIVTVPFRCLRVQMPLIGAELLPEIEWVQLTTDGVGGGPLPVGRIDLGCLNPLGFFTAGADYEVVFRRIEPGFVNGSR